MDYTLYLKLTAITYTIIFQSYGHFSSILINFELFIDDYDFQVVLVLFRSVFDIILEFLVIRLENVLRNSFKVFLMVV